MDITSPLFSLFSPLPCKDISSHLLVFLGLTLVPLYPAWVYAFCLFFFDTLTPSHLLPLLLSNIFLMSLSMLSRHAYALHICVLSPSQFSFSAHFLSSPLFTIRLNYAALPFPLCPFHLHSWGHRCPPTCLLPASPSFLQSLASL